MYIFCWGGVISSSFFHIHVIIHFILGGWGLWFAGSCWQLLLYTTLDMLFDFETEIHNESDVEMEFKQVSQQK